MSIVQNERDALVDVLRAVGPDAPTLCEGWLTHDLAAHLWIRETDPVGAGGIVARPLAGFLERRMAETKARWPYPELVDKVRNGPARFSVFAIPGVDEGANTIEYFVHHEDVRRAGDEPHGARTLPDDVEGWLWRRLKLLARAQFRRAKVGVVLEREGSRNGDGEPETIRAAAGTHIVTVVGRPSELTLFAHGRTGTAQVRLVGEPEAVEQLLGSELSE
jgi:uncharacterized protein (TIGR03085 family)